MNHVAAGGRDAMQEHDRRAIPERLTSEPVTLPLDFGPHWDTGRQQIGPAGPLRNGSGLRLVSGLEMGTAKIEDDHLVGAAHDTGGLRR